MRTPPIVRSVRLFRSLRAAVLVAAVAGLCATTTGPALADELIAADPVAATVARAPGTVTAPAITAAASLPAGIVVGNHSGQPVTLLAKGEPIRRVTLPGARAATFTHLTPGRMYTVEVGGVRVGALRAVNRPNAATGLTVRTTTTSGSVALAWQHRRTIATGGADTWYVVTATAAGAPTIRRTALGRPTTTLDGLDHSALYTFTVVPRNSAGAGRATRAVMSRPLSPPAAPAAIPAPVAEAPTVVTPPPAPAAAPAAAESRPATRTIYVCPRGSTQTASGTCQVVQAYTYTTQPYTYHDEATGPAPILDSYGTTVRACPSSHNLEDYGWVMYCRRYGAAPTETVKDVAPTGFTDDGTQWTRRNPAPAGFTDDGQQWIRTVDKVATVVPA